MSWHFNQHKAINREHRIHGAQNLQIKTMQLKIVSRLIYDNLLYQESKHYNQHILAARIGLLSLKEMNEIGNKGRDGRSFFRVGINAYFCRSSCNVQIRLKSSKVVIHQKCLVYLGYFPCLSLSSAVPRPLSRASPSLSFVGLPVLYTARDWIEDQLDVVRQSCRIFLSLCIIIILQL